MSGMPPPADPSRTSIFSAVALTEAREEAEFAKEEAAFYFRKLELAQELCERSATEGRSAACAPAVLRLLFMSEEEIACLDDPGQLLAPAMEA